MFSFSYRNLWHQQHFFCIKPPINFSYPDYTKERVVPQQLYPSIPPSFSVLSFPSAAATWDWLLPVKARVTADFGNTAPIHFLISSTRYRGNSRKKGFWQKHQALGRCRAATVLFPCVGAILCMLAVSCGMT